MPRTNCSTYPCTWTSTNPNSVQARLHLWSGQEQVDIMQSTTAGLSLITNLGGSIWVLFFFSVFAECHRFVSPENFYQGCVFDSCHISNPAVECTSLQTYAAACAQAGVCIHWRNHTKLCGKQPFIILLCSFWFTGCCKLICTLEVGLHMCCVLKRSFLPWQRVTVHQTKFTSHVALQSNQPVKTSRFQLMWSVNILQFSLYINTKPMITMGCDHKYFLSATWGQ